MNKKAQYYQPPQEEKPAFADISPIMIIGVIIFVIPFLLPIAGIRAPGWVTTVGFVLVIIGLLHSVARKVLG